MRHCLDNLKGHNITERVPRRLTPRARPFQAMVGAGAVRMTGRARARHGRAVTMCRLPTAGGGARGRGTGAGHSRDMLEGAAQLCGEQQ